MDLRIFLDWHVLAFMHYLCLLQQAILAHCALFMLAALMYVCESMKHRIRCGLRVCIEHYVQYDLNSVFPLIYRMQQKYWLNFTYY